MGRRRLAIAAAAVVAAVAVGVSGAISSESSASGARPGGSVPTNRPSSRVSAPRTSPDPAVHSDPFDLVGSWKVSGPGVEPGTSLLLGDTLKLFRRCGLITGSWQADRHGLFIGDVGDGGDAACFHAGQGGPPRWLRAAAAYRVDGRARQLLALDGSVVARLSAHAHPRTGVPTVTAALRTYLRTPRALPTGLHPATPAALAGRWQAVGPHAGNPSGYVEFSVDGAWAGTDGCNGSGGRFGVGAAGELLVTSGVTTAVGCGGSPAPSWVVEARRAGFDGPALVLFDKTGHRLGRLVRQPTGTVEGTFREVGGPAPGLNVALDGQIVVHLPGDSNAITAGGRATRGRFLLSVPPGRWVIDGTSTTVPGAVCSSTNAVTVTAEETTHAAVFCQID
jgi:hypothetical protein